MVRKRSSGSGGLGESVTIVSLLALGALTIRFSLLPDPFGTGSDPTKLPGAGRLRRIAGQVRFRPASTPLWRDVTEAYVGLRDDFQVFTGEAGIAELTLAERSLRLSPNTLMRIGAEPRAVTTAPSLRARRPEAVELEHGRVAVRLGGDAPELLARAGGRTYRVTAGEGATQQGEVVLAAPPISSDGSSLGITVEGSVPFAVSSDSGPLRNVPAGAALSIGEPDSDSVVSLPLPWRADAPIDGGRIIVRGNAGAGALPVELSWEMAPGIDPALWNDSLRVSVTGAGGVRTLEASAAKRRVRLELAPGDYGWRLEGITRDGRIARGAWRAFTVVALRSPSLRAPEAGETFSAPAGATASLRFVWHELPAGQIGELEISSIGAQGREARRITGDATGVATELAPGRYSARVRARTSEGEGSDWSAAREFGVEDRSVRVAPPSPVPAPSPTPSPTPAPKPVPTKKVAPPPPPKRILPSPSPSPSPIPPPPRKAPVAPPRVARIPTPRLPREGARIEEGARVTLTWESLGQGSAYQVEVAEDAAFTRILFQTDAGENYAFWQPPGPGQFHWRVRGTAKSPTRWTPTRHFRVAGAGE